MDARKRLNWMADAFFAIAAVAGALAFVIGPFWSRWDVAAYGGVMYLIYK